MKAVLCKEYGLPGKLVIEEVPSPKAGNGQVVVSVKACGVNFPDTLIIQGKYQFKPEMPFSPGGEVAGIVKEIGEGVTRVKPGDRDIAFQTRGGSAGARGVRRELRAGGRGEGEGGCQGRGACRNYRGGRRAGRRARDRPAAPATLRRRSCSA